MENEKQDEVTIWFICLVGDVLTMEFKKIMLALLTNFSCLCIIGHIGHIKMTWFHLFCKPPPQKKKMLNLQLTKNSAAYCLSNFN